MNDCNVLAGFGKQLGLNVEANPDWCCKEAVSSYFTCKNSSVNALRVTAIKLDAYGLTGTVPSSIGNLTELVELNIRRNYLDGSLPASISSLLELKRLLLDDNDLGSACVCVCLGG